MAVFRCFSSVKKAKTNKIKNNLPLNIYFSIPLVNCPYCVVIFFHQYKYYILILLPCSSYSVYLTVFEHRFLYVPSWPICPITWRLLPGFLNFLGNKSNKFFSSLLTNWHLRIHHTNWNCLCTILKLFMKKKHLASTYRKVFDLFDDTCWFISVDEMRVWAWQRQKRSSMVSKVF